MDIGRLGDALVNQVKQFHARQASGSFDSPAHTPSATPSRLRSRDVSPQRGVLDSIDLSIPRILMRKINRTRLRATLHSTCQTTHICQTEYWQIILAGHTDHMAGGRMDITPGVVEPSSVVRKGGFGNKFADKLQPQQLESLWAAVVSDKEQPREQPGSMTISHDLLDIAPSPHGVEVSRIRLINEISMLVSHVQIL